MAQRMALAPCLLMTRPTPASQSFAASLPAELLASVRMVLSPLTEIAHKGALPDMSRFAGLIFTSRNGVQAYLKAGGPTDLPAFAVGEATASEAMRAGLKTQSANGDAQALVDLLQEVAPKPPLLHIRGQHVTGDIARRLSAIGLETDEAVLYDQLALGLNDAAKAALMGDAPVVAPVFSPRSGALLVRETAMRAPLFFAAMSEAVAKPLQALHTRAVKVACRPDSASMAQAVAELIEEALTFNGRMRDS